LLPCWPGSPHQTTGLTAFNFIHPSSFSDRNQAHLVPWLPNYETPPIQFLPTLFILSWESNLNPKKLSDIWNWKCFNNSVEMMISYITWSLFFSGHFLSGFGSPKHPNSWPLILLYINKNKPKNIRDMLFQGVNTLPTMKNDFIVSWEQNHRIKYILVPDFWAFLFGVISLKMIKPQQIKEKNSNWNSIYVATSFSSKCNQNGFKQKQLSKARHLLRGKLWKARFCSS